MTCDIYYQLPSGVKMPAIGYGTWLSTDEAQLESAIDAALEVGYRHIDTAYFYLNENIIGRVLNRWISEGKLTREDIFLVSKLPPNAMRAEDVPTFLHESLEKLQLDYLDLYLIHVPFGFKNIEGTLCPFKEDGDVDADESTDLVAIWKAMEDQVDAGIAKNIGFSNFNQQQIQKILDVARIKPCCLQVEMHAYFQQNKLREFCKEQNLVITAYSSLGNPGLSKLGLQLPDILNNPVVGKIARKYGRSPAQILLRHLLQKEVVIIPKSVNPDRVRENFSVFDFSLSYVDMEALNKLDADVRILTFTPIFKGIEKHPEYPFTEDI